MTLHEQRVQPSSKCEDCTIYKGDIYCTMNCSSARLMPMTGPNHSGLRDCPTPWCNHRDQPYVWQGLDDLFQVICADCQVHGPAKASQSEAREAWNYPA